jgi:hypothetical protein
MRFELMPWLGAALFQLSYPRSVPHHCTGPCYALNVVMGMSRD